MQLILKSISHYNPQQKCFQPKPTRQSGQMIEVRNFKEASIKCKEFIESHNVGSGNWAGGQVFYKRALVAEVSYEGRVWTPGPSRNEIKF